MSSTAQRTKRRQAREETRRQILDEAEIFLREKHYREVSVDGLMASTGHTRTAFYRHFDDVPDLVLAVLQDVGGELYEVSQRWVASAGDGEGAAREGLAAIVDFFARHGTLMRAVAEGAYHDEEIEKIYGGFIRMFEDLTEKAIADMLAEGKVRALNPRETARALTCMNERYLIDSFGRAPIADREEVLAALTEIWRRVLYGNGVAHGDG